MSYAQLTLEERFTIYHLKLFKLTVREIARRLNRHHSTVSRELKRNGPRYVGGVYWAVAAQHRAEQRRQRARHQRRRSNAALCQYVMQRLQAHWSPEIIAGRLTLDFPADASMRLRIATTQFYVLSKQRANCGQDTQPYDERLANQFIHSRGALARMNYSSFYLEV